jgi:hypothetical protein
MKSFKGLNNIVMYRRVLKNLEKVIEKIRAVDNIYKCENDQIRCRLKGKNQVKNKMQV